VVADILFKFDVDASRAAVLEAVKTADGIRGFWTTRAEVPSEVGGTLKLGFAIAPAPFDLLLEQSDPGTVMWRPQTFPPHWVGTTIRWDVESRGEGATVGFRHAGFAADDDAAHAAYTWGQIMVRLKEYVETDTRNPVFT
jgi:hypothetical protein